MARANLDETTRERPRGLPYDKSDYLALLALAALWAALVLSVDPRGDFPLLDDWSYGRSVKILIEQGNLHYDGWNAATLFAQVLYGAAFCLPFGFSFETLRVSTLIAGLAGCLGTYALLREASASKVIAFLGSLVVALNPAYFQHAFTFMTDVPFTALAVLSALFYLRALRTGSSRDVLVGTFLACCATLVRQTGVAIPFAYGIALLSSHAISRRVLVQAAVPTLATLAVLQAYQGLIDYLGMTAALQGVIRESILRNVAEHGIPGMAFNVLGVGSALFSHLALYALPCVFVLIGYRSWPGALSLPQWAGLLAMPPALFVFLYWKFWPSPLPAEVFEIAHNLIPGQRPWGAAGEPTLFRQAILLMELAAISTIAFYLALVVVDRVGRRTKAISENLGALIFGSVVSIVMLAPFVLAGHFFERYLIPILPFFVLVLVALNKSSGRLSEGVRQSAAVLTAVIVLGAYGAISIVFAHDLLIWNRVRWNAVNYLVHDQDVDPSEIDGGLPVNGWYLFDKVGPLRDRYINWRTVRGKWWRNEGAEYVIGYPRPDSLERLSGQGAKLSTDQARIIWQKSYTGWLPRADGSMVICRGEQCPKFFYRARFLGKAPSPSGMH
jgi:hypothetical protein